MSDGEWSRVRAGPGPISSPTAVAEASPFQSFWMGGFEGADHLNRHGTPLDMAHACGHLAHLDADYGNAAAHGFGSVRESVGWRLAEPMPGRFDFSRAKRLVRAANRHGLQVVWTLMHYGTPADIDLNDDAFIDRFAAYAAAAAEAIGVETDDAPVYNPINEIGFLAWAISETSQFYPYRSDLRGGATSSADSTEASGYDVKRRLARGVLAAIDAIRRVDSRARFVHVEPLVHVVAPPDRPELAEMAQTICDYQWQAWDLIAGFAEPGLGGSVDALDRVGVNHYHSGQWEVATEQRLFWHLNDPRRRPLAALLDAAWQRYRRPLVIAETSHFGAGRALWLNEIAAEARAALAAGVPLEGLCLYPLVDRPDWDNVSHWHHSGLWDVTPPRSETGSAPLAQRMAGPEPALGRVLNAEYSAAVRGWQGELPGLATAPRQALRRK